MDPKSKSCSEIEHVVSTIDLANSASTHHLRERLTKALFSCLSVRNVSNFNWLRGLTPIRRTRCLILNNCSVSTDDFIKLFTIFPLIEDLRMVNTTPEVDSVSMEQISNWKTLRHIALLSDTPSSASDTDDNRFFSIITTQCQNLSTMYIEHRGINDASFESFSERHGPYMKRLWLCAQRLTGISYHSLSLYKNLTAVDFDHAANMTNDNLLSILSMQRLRRIRIEDGRLLFAGNFEALFKNKHFHALRELIIFRCDWLDDKALYSLIRCCPRLEKLRLEKLPAITNQGLMRIVQFCRRVNWWAVRWCPRVSGNCNEQIRIRFAELEIKCPEMYT